eukprot:10635132-Alexandrium_andersonii.AAC.1
MKPLHTFGKALLNNAATKREDSILTHDSGQAITRMRCTGLGGASAPQGLVPRLCGRAIVVRLHPRGDRSVVLQFAAELRRVLPEALRQARCLRTCFAITNVRRQTGAISPQTPPSPQHPLTRLRSGCGRRPLFEARRCPK